MLSLPLLLELKFFFLLCNTLLFFDLVLIRLHVAIDLVHQPVLVVFIELWLLHLRVSTSQQPVTVIRWVKSGLPWLGQIVLRSVFCTDRLLSEHGKVLVLSQYRALQLLVELLLGQTVVKVHLVATALKLLNGLCYFAIALRLPLPQLSCLRALLLVFWICRFTLDRRLLGADPIFILPCPAVLLEREVVLHQKAKGFFEGLRVK